MNLKNNFFLKEYIKMEKTIKNLVVLKSKNKNSTNIKDLFQLKTQILIKQQYLIRSLLVKKDLNDVKKIRPLCVFLPKNECIKKKTLMELNICSFLIKDDELLEKYNAIKEKVKNNLKKEFDNEPVYNEKYLKAKIKSYIGKINSNFKNNKIPKKGS